jgi:hypothetical protein
VFHLGPHDDLLSHRRELLVPSSGKFPSF